MNHIHKLSSKIAAQIAAGEVVERPASIVKELVENSLDAGANIIDIKVKDGGLSLIEVIDNGHGIYKDELGLALDTHSTSKIKDLKDINSIKTLGFRGEALSSITAVSKLSLSSRHIEEQQGWSVSAADGEIKQLKPVALNQGTRVVVQDIFYNTPARRKFLRTKATEYYNIEQTFIRLALGNHKIGFTLTRDDKIIYKLSPWRKPTKITDSNYATSNNDDNVASVEFKQSSSQRITELLGMELCNNLEFFENNSTNYYLHGWTVLPAFAPSKSNIQFLYVNGRFVRDKIFSHAVKRAYGERLHGLRMPAYIVYMDIPANEVDVNVHPGKYEVRFNNGNKIHSLTRGSISKAIGQNAGDYTMNLNSYENTNLKKFLDSPLKNKSLSSNFGKPFNADYGSGSSHTSPVGNFTRVQEALSPFAYDKELIKQEKTSFEEGFTPPLGYAVAHMHGIYIVSINSQGIVITDAHAAHERVVFERMKEQWGRNKLEIQPFLLPVIINLLPGESDFIAENIKSLKIWGLELRVIGIGQAALESIPAALDKENAAEMVRAVCEDLREYSKEGNNSDDELAEKILASMACHGSVRANRNLSIQEMNSLLRQVEKTESGHLCNHGRPTWFQIERSAIDKKLLRGS